MKGGGRQKRASKREEEELACSDWLAGALPRSPSGRRLAAAACQSARAKFHCGLGVRGELLLLARRRRLVQLREAGRAERSLLLLPPPPMEE